jgi:NAD(P)-dependent dehydrogenase (short-subunit alcohol dehydrogenase family)
MKSWYSLEGKNIWVIGGAGHLGSAITEALDGLCDRTVCLDIEGRAAVLVSRRSLGRTAAEDLDVTAVGALSGRLEALVARHGVPDGVVHLATAFSVGKALDEIPPEEFGATFDRALTPAFVVCRTLAGHMKARGSGSIVLFASMYGVVSPDPRIYDRPRVPPPIDYGASKAAVIQMTRYLAVFYGPAGVRFNCVTPGPFPSPQVQASGPEFIGDLNRKVPMGRIGRNDEIVGPTLFLLGDGASYVTGHSLAVDGGWTAW